MKVLLIILAFVCLNFTAISAQVSLDSLRNWYVLAVEDEDEAEAMIQHLNHYQDLNGLQTAFLASAQALLAKHAYNPYYKLAYVKDAETTFKQAVQKDPSNPEVRFMRLAVEHYVPSFLGYSENIDEDLGFLYNYLIRNTSRKDDPIYSVIKNFVLETERLSEKQISLLR